MLHTSKRSSTCSLSKRSRLSPNKFSKNVYITFCLTFVTTIAIANPSFAWAKILDLLFGNNCSFSCMKMSNYFQIIGQWYMYKDSSKSLVKGQSSNSLGFFCFCFKFLLLFFLIFIFMNMAYFLTLLYLCWDRNCAILYYQNRLYKIEIICIHTNIAYKYRYRSR